MKILITGSNGQLGNEIRLLANNYPQSEFIFTDVDELDITNAQKVDAFFTTHQPEAVINCAAYTAVDKAETDEGRALLLNATAVENLAKAATKVGALMVQISTDYVFDGKSFLPYTEEDQTNPQSVYGRTKLAGEKAVQQFASKGIILRTAWLYSAFGNNFIKTMIKYGTEREELKVVFDQIGTPTYAKDLAQSILDILPKAILEDGTELFHYSNEGVASWYDFAHLVITSSNIKCALKPITTKEYPTPASRPFYSVLNKTKIKERYHITIPHWTESVLACINRLKKQ